MLFINLKLDISDTSKFVIPQTTVKILPSGEQNSKKRVLVHVILKSDKYGEN
jgi:hypothetical protein